jgi:polyhydroxybutyrate depolymerase
VRARPGGAALGGLAVAAAAVLVVLHPWARDRSQLVRLQVGGRDRSYVAFVPHHRDPRASLVVFLPGLGMSAEEGRRATQLDAGARRRGAVVVYAQGVHRSWNAGSCCGGAKAQRVDDVAFLTAVIADARRRYGISPPRAAVVGFSNGALMAYRYACEEPDQVQALVVGSGAGLARTCAAGRPVRLLAMHGKQDTVDPYVGGPSSSVEGYVAQPVADVVLTVAKDDGCVGKPTQLRDTALLEVGAATGCPPGVSVRLCASKTMKHHWSTGQADEQRYGFDESVLTWTFLASTWS